MRDIFRNWSKIDQVFVQYSNKYRTLHVEASLLQDDSSTREGLFRLNHATHYCNDLSHPALVDNWSQYIVGSYLIDDIPAPMLGSCIRNIRFSKKEGSWESCRISGIFKDSYIKTSSLIESYTFENLDFEITFDYMHFFEDKSVECTLKGVFNDKYWMLTTYLDGLVDMFYVNTSYTEKGCYRKRGVSAHTRILNHLNSLYT